MKILLLGVPCSGKGTQSMMLSKYLNIPHISASNLLRQEILRDTCYGKIIKNSMNTGELISDNIINHIIKKEIYKFNDKNGFILDGFPRTLYQLHFLNTLHIIFDYIIEIYISDQDVIDRVCGRRIHKSSGRIYHLTFNPPKKYCVDDFTGEPLIQRKDDTKKVIINRLENFYKNTQPVIKYYKDLLYTSNIESNKNNKLTHFYTVHGIESMHNIFNRILSIIDK